jgi:hypothetical protein
MVNGYPPHRPRYRSKRTSKPVDNHMIVDIWNRLQAGLEAQHEIAASHGINQGRVSEINTGKRGAHITGLSPR